MVGKKNSTTRQAVRSEAKQPPGGPQPERDVLDHLASILRMLWHSPEAREWLAKDWGAEQRAAAEHSLSRTMQLLDSGAMRRGSAKERAALNSAAADLGRLWEIALGRGAAHEHVSIDFLRNIAARILNGVPRSTRAIFEPAVVRAYGAQDRGELARELIKIIYYVGGNAATDFKLGHVAKTATFSRLHAPVPDDYFAMVWNRPGTEDLKPAQRARRLLKDLGSTSVENALRRVRRMVNRGWEMTGYVIGSGGRAKQAR